MTCVLETTGLGRRYGNLWALQDCALSLAPGHLAGLVGPNGAGKTTLLHLIMGLLAPTTGAVRVSGYDPLRQPLEMLKRVGFVAQDRPLYRSFTVHEMLTFGARLNTRWDGALARQRLARLGIPTERRIAQLSGGQQAQVALVLALAKCPELLILDEPVGNLDPLARREFLQLLMESVAETGQTVLLSSHQIGDLDRVCDYLIVLAGGQVQAAEDMQEFQQRHHWLICPSEQAGAVAQRFTVLQAGQSARASTFLVRTDGAEPVPGWDMQPASLEDIILAYLARPTHQKACEGAAQ